MKSQKIRNKADEIFFGVIHDIKLLTEKSALYKDNKRVSEKVKKLVFGNNECIQMVDDLIQEQKNVCI